MSENNVIKSTALGGHDAWDRNRYLNIWVCNLTGGVLGYAQLPGGPSSTDGVVIAYKYFGISGASYPYNQGRTTTHEVGHFFNLLHVWGDDNGACWGTDYCDDTPNQASDNYGCPTFPHPSCNNTSDMYMNYMDYVDDACMYMFTFDQAERMEATLSGFRALLAASNGCSPPVGLPESSNIYGFQVYPVPTGDLFTVKFSMPLPRECTMTVYNELGEVLLSRKVAAAAEVREDIDISNLNPGLYILKVDAPGQSMVEKIMKY
jgi:hypothetical protein